MVTGTNAEASSSRHPRPATTTPPAHGDSLKGKKPLSVDTTCATQPDQPTKTEAQVQPRSSNPSRKVRTVPPSAAFNPPTPPSGPPSPLPDVSRDAGPSTAGPSTTDPRKRRARRLRYSTSEFSSDSHDSGSESDEAAWWTFTQTGMAKMRARSMRKRNEPVRDEAAGVESGRDSGRKGKTRRESRPSSKGKSRDSSTPSSSIYRAKRQNSGEGKLASSLRRPMNLRTSTSSSPHGLLWQRSATRDHPLSLLTKPQSTPMVRSSSAPCSPVRDSIHLDLAPSHAIAGTDTPRISEEHLNSHSVSPSRVRALRPKRQSTAPAFPRFRRRLDQAEVLTDTEAGSAPSPRVKARARTAQTSDYDVAPFAPEDGPSTPNPQANSRQKQGNRIRITLPPPITQHFTNGWPHAGSWQDAYYGTYCESPQMENEAVRPRNLSISAAEMRRYPPKPKESKSSKKSNLEQSDRNYHVHVVPVRLSSLLSKHRRESRRARRFRQAQTPPTPSGLGFTPGGADRGEAWKEGWIGAGGNRFDWGTMGRASAIEETDELSRANTRATMSEKMTGTTEKTPKPWWRCGRKAAHAARGGTRLENIGWKKKWRRMLFLDARVTIWIRALNLTTVVTSLALAVTIRMKLDQLGLPGLLGSSTTLVISYSALTALHVLTAIYREYFGKPIGLWGLRSKMLWVCLDLIFIALWSSAMSLSVNDFISTELECTSSVPWWRGGLAQDYSELLERLQLLGDTGINGNTTTLSVTSPEMVAHSIEIILPNQVIESPLAHEICERQLGSIALSLITLLLYSLNMVLSLFRIFETVRLTANVDRTVMV